MSQAETEALVQELANAIGAASGEFDERRRAIGISLYELLAEGEPVSQAALAIRAGIDEKIIAESLDRWPGVFRDEQSRVIGWGGLAIPEMDHRFQAEGAKPMYAWCAVDPFLIVPVIGRPAQVESKDPVTGEPIRMTVTPAGIADLYPAEAVVSFLKPDKAFDQDVIQTFCQYVLFFASRSSAQRWASERHGIVLLPVADAFQVGRLAWSSLRRTAA